MFNVLRNKPSIVLEAQKARFKPKYIIQIIIFIAVFLVTQITAAFPLVIVTIVKVIIDVSGGNVNIGDYSYNESYISEMMESSTLIMLFCTIIATFLTIIYCRFIERRSLYSMGFVKKKAISDYTKGLFIGAAMFGASVLISWLSGTLEYKGVILGNSLGLVIAFFFGFVFQGMSEEVILRGYLMVSIASKKPIILAILTNSIIFALVHLLNSGITLLSIINLTLFGIFASVYVLRADSIWGICAIHSTWNFTQGNIFGILVSGSKVNASVLSFLPTETGTLINGGSFGLEGGLAVTIVLVISIAITMLIKGKSESLVQSAV